MKVKELIEALQKMPPGAVVLVSAEHYPVPVEQALGGYYLEDGEDQPEFTDDADLADECGGHAAVLLDA